MENNFNSNNEVLSFFIYMWNKFSQIEAINIWGGSIDDEYCLGNYMWHKYMILVDNYGQHAAISKLCAELDDINLNLLVQRACKFYDGRNYRNI